MTNAFPIISLVTLISTNWVPIPGDFRRESGTNFVKQRQVIVTNVFIEEVSLCTNRTIYKQSQGTNGAVRWQVVEPVTPPPLPGQFTKP